MVREIFETEQPLIFRDIWPVNAPSILNGVIGVR